MRKPILIPCLTLALSLSLASCGGKQAANSAEVSEDTGAGDVTAVNDTTAIDAATGEAANMAADVNYTFNDEDLNSAANSSSSTSSTKPKRKSAPAPAPRPGEPAVTNNAAQ